MDILNFISTLLPIGVVVYLMLYLHWKSTHAGLVGWASAVLIAYLAFGAGMEVLLWAQVRAFFLALYVLYIIWGAFLFYRVTEGTGTIKAMAELLKALSPDRAFQVLLLAWGFASFLQSISGFGIPVAIIAPLLVGMGFPTLAAIILPSLGYAWAVPFGSLGTPFYALVATTHIEGDILASWSALYLGLICLITAAFTLWAAGGCVALRQGAIPMILMGSTAAIAQWGAAQAGLWDIGAMIGALTSLLIGSTWALIRNKSSRALQSIRSFLPRALIPYALLLALIFSAQWIKPFHTMLNTIILRIPVPEVTTSKGWITEAGPTHGISIFGHTGALLLYASSFLFLVARKKGILPKESGGNLLREAIQKGSASTLGILSMVAMATTMEHAGMIAFLSQMLARATGDAFIFLTPFLGALGAFVTGSNTNSNILFGVLQRDIAHTLGYTVPLILAAQHVGAALGSTFAPAKVIVGCSTVECKEQEPEVMKKLIRYNVTALGILALVTGALAHLV